MFNSINHHFYSVWQHLFQQTILIIPKLFVAIIVLVIFVIAGYITKILFMKLMNRRKHPYTVFNLLGKTIRALIIIIGVITALGTIGINVSALVASLGLFGFAAGFAFKDFLSNTLAGIMILIYKPYKVNQDISGKDFQGKVREINLRYTVLDSDINTVLVPNATMLNTVINIQK